MKKTMILMMSLCLMTTIVSASGMQDLEDTSLADIKAKGHFVLGLDDSFPPMGFRNEAGDIDGFDIDMAKAVAKKLGIELELKPVDWDGVILSLKKGDIDVVWNGMTITESRKAQISFSKPYLENKQILVTAAGNTFTDSSELAGKVIGLQMGSSSEQALASNESVSSSLKEVRKYSNNIEALLDLAAGRLDGVVVDEIVGRYYITKKPDLYDVVTAFDFGAEAYGIGFRKDDFSFRNALDAVLDDMRKDGTAAAISKKWFGENIVTD